MQYFLFKILYLQHVVVFPETRHDLFIHYHPVWVVADVQGPHTKSITLSMQSKFKH